MLTGSALKNKGIQPMLDAVIDYLPSPLDVPPVIGQDPRHRRRGACARSTTSEPFAALAFKIAADPFVGKLAFFRVYSGTLKAGTYVSTPSKGSKERIGRILQMHANHREDIEQVYAGDIAAAVGLKDTFTGDTLSDPGARRRPRVDDLPRAGHRGRHRAQDEGRPGQARPSPSSAWPRRTRPSASRPTRRRRQTLIAGMGELHLDVLVDRMVREFKVAANVGKPQVSYRETVRARRAGQRPLRAPDRWSRPVRPRRDPLEPQEKGNGYEFVDKIVGGTIPREYIKPVDAGIREALETGIFAGFPVVDVKVTLYDGSYHDVDSSEMAFKIAGSMAVKDAFEKADPIILEPIMKVEVIMPEEFMGDVIGDLNSRRGHIEGMESRGRHARSSGPSCRWP